MNSYDQGSFLNNYVIHAYRSPFPEHGDDVIMWDFVGRRVEAVVKPPKMYPTSCLLTAADLRMKEQVLIDLKAVSAAWVYHNGRENPHAEHHTAAYLEIKARLEDLSAKVIAALKAYFASPYAPKNPKISH